MRLASSANSAPYMFQAGPNAFDVIAVPPTGIHVFEIEAYHNGGTLRIGLAAENRSNYGVEMSVAYTESGQLTVYLDGYDYDQNEFSIDKTVSPGALTGWVKHKFKLDQTNREISGKVWASADAEPSAYQLVGVDDNYDIPVPTVGIGALALVVSLTAVKSMDIASFSWEQIG